MAPLWRLHYWLSVTGGSACYHYELKRDSYVKYAKDTTLILFLVKCLDLPRFASTNHCSIYLRPVTNMHCVVLWTFTTHTFSTILRGSSYGIVQVSRAGIEVINCPLPISSMYLPTTHCR